MELTLKSLSETREIGRRIGSLLKAGDVVALDGPLGAGKTALVGGIAEGLPVDPGFSVTSPTFVFAHIYEGPVPLYHIDLYRVEKEEELPGIGIGEMLGGEGVAAVEWFSRFPAIWTGDRLEIEIRFGKGDERRMVLRAKGEKAQAVIESLNR